MVVSEVPAQLCFVPGFGVERRNPTGFAPRLRHLLGALASRWPIDLVGVIEDPRDQGGAFVDPAVTGIEYEEVLVPPSRLGRHAAGSRVHSWLQFSVGRLPAWSRPRRLAQLERTVAQRQPALVVLYMPQLAHLALRLPAGIPVICHLEEAWDRHSAEEILHRSLGRARRTWLTTTESWRAARLYRRIGRQATVVAISEQEAERFARWIPNDRLVVVEHGIDCELFAPGGKDGDDIDVGVFGNLFATRNQQATIDAWRASQSGASAAWQWAFVGRTSTLLQDAVSSTGALLPGVVPDVRPFYERSRVVLVPSSSGAGVKTTLLQAWAMGRPVVTTPFGVTGLPAEAERNVLIGESPAEMVRQVARLLGSADLRHRIGSGGRATVAAHRDMKLIAARYTALCEAVMATGTTDRQ